MHCVKVIDEGSTNLLKIFKYAQMLQTHFLNIFFLWSVLLPYLKMNLDSLKL